MSQCQLEPCHPCLDLPLLSTPQSRHQWACLRGRSDRHHRNHPVHQNSQTWWPSCLQRRPKDGSSPPAPSGCLVVKGTLDNHAHVINHLFACNEIHEGSEGLHCLCLQVPWLRLHSRLSTNNFADKSMSKNNKELWFPDSIQCTLLANSPAKIKHSLPPSNCKGT